MNGPCHKKGTSGVISMRGWKEGRRLEEAIRSGLFYQSLVANDSGGHEDDVSGHFEIAYSVSAEDFPEDERYLQIAEEEIPWSDTDPSWENVIPFHRTVIERYEFYDLNTDDIHVIYRIPHKPWGF